jgi:hypothetical protein
MSEAFLTIAAAYLRRFILPAWVTALMLIAFAGTAPAQTTAELDLVNANYFSPAITDSGCTPVRIQRAR